jgi:hypothetical protein
LEEKRVMPIQKYKPEQIMTMLRQIEVSIANGKTTPQACKEATIEALLTIHSVQKIGQVRTARSVSSRGQRLAGRRQPADDTTRA